MRWWYLDNKDRTQTQQRVVNVCLALSRLGNALAGGDPNVSISERVGNGADRGDVVCLRYLEPLIDGLLLEPGHCRKEMRIWRAIRGNT